MQTLDWRLFELFNGLARHRGALDGLMKLCAGGLEHAMVAIGATLWITPGEDEAVCAGRRRLVIDAVIAAALGLAINHVIGLAWFRPCPYAVHSVKLLVAPSPDSSFPSDHATGGFVLALAVALARDRWARWLGWLLLALVVLLACARVYIGTHYPFDVIAGGLIGAGAAVVVWYARPFLDALLRPLLAPLDRLTEATVNRLGGHR